MGRRLLPVLLIATAQICDWEGDHGLAKAALLAALPFAAVRALVVFGEYIDSRGAGLAGVKALCSAGIVTFLVLSCAVRSDAVHGFPPLATSSLAVAIGLLAIKASIVSAQYARRLDTLSPAKP